VPGPSEGNMQAFAYRDRGGLFSLRIIWLGLSQISVLDCEYSHIYSIYCEDVCHGGKKPNIFIM